jgi:N-methylhydantoinase B
MRARDRTPHTSHDVEPLVLEVAWNRLLATANEQQATLVRTAFSTVVRESQDLACGVFDTHGHMVAQSETGTPGHINAMATGVRHFLTAFPAETLAPGDVLITNDPWKTAGQINDITLVTPIYHRERIAAYFANTCHMADIGGRILSAEAREVYEEGLFIPLTKLFRAGVRNEDLFALLRANVRTPGEVEGDLYAMAGCNDAGGRRLVELLDEYGWPTLDPLAGAIISRSERAVREAIAALPDGVYTSEIWSDGFEEPVRLAATVTIAVDELTVDHAGSSPQSRHGINVVLNYTHAYTSFAVKCVIAPDVPHNEGAFRPVHVTAPPGCILNAQHPAPVAARHLIGHFLPNLLFGALAPVLPDKIMADGAAALWITVFRGRRRMSTEPFSFTLFQCGGTGARATQDGLSAVGFPSGVAGVPAEVMETLTPLVITERKLRTDSGGAGRWRGGLGQVTRIACRTDEPWGMSGLYDRTRFPAAGLFGGHAGLAGEFETTGGEPATPREFVSLAPESEAIISLPGGGGYGHPVERDPTRVLDDVVNGYVSIEAAEREYGVRITCSRHAGERVILPERYALDLEATRNLRARCDTRRAQSPPTSQRSKRTA